MTRLLGRLQLTMISCEFLLLWTPQLSTVEKHSSRPLQILFKKAIRAEVLAWKFSNLPMWPALFLLIYVLLAVVFKRGNLLSLRSSRHGLFNMLNLACAHYKHAKLAGSDMSTATNLCRYSESVQNIQVVQVQLCSAWSGSVTDLLSAALFCEQTLPCSRALLGASLHPADKVCYHPSARRYWVWAASQHHCWCVGATHYETE